MRRLQAANIQRTSGANLHAPRFPNTHPNPLLGDAAPATNATGGSVLIDISPQLGSYALDRRRGHRRFGRQSNAQVAPHKNDGHHIYGQAFAQT